MKIGPERLTQVREERGLTVLELALLFQMAPAPIYTAENGSRNPGPKLLALYEKHGLLSASEVLAHLLGDAA